MPSSTVLEKYVRSPFPAFQKSHVPYLTEELRKIEQALGGAYSAMRSTGPYIKMPFGVLMSTVDQVALSTTTAYPIKFNIVQNAAGISYQNDSQIKVDHDGVYNIQFSIQFINTSNEPQEVDVWFRKNGVNLENSNSMFTVPAKKSTGISGHLIGSLNIFLDILSTDYAELVWSTTSLDASVETLPARTSPSIPVTPSVIVTLDYLSGL